MLTLENLIRKGYFPEEIIPPLNTESLGNELHRILRTAQSMPKNRMHSKCCNHSIPRLKHLRRRLGIPNPLSQILLSNKICENWVQLNNKVNESTLSLSTPLVIVDSKRALTRRYAFSQVNIERILKSTDCRYMLRTDISRYYPTIYTHSIPWALHTKQTAKANRGDNLYGNIIDKYARNCMDQQTIGIPIGPDTSLLIGEVIATALDSEIIRFLGQVKGFRYLDDYFLFFNSLSDTEKALSKIHRAAKEYELELNSVKTNIVELPDPLEMRWVLDLRMHTFRNNQKGQHTDLISYFSKAYENSKLYPEDFVLKYSLSRIKGLFVHQDNWSLYESLILKSIIAEPSCLPIATQIFLAYLNQGYTLNNDKILATIGEIITYHSKFSHEFEIAWALWLAKTLRITIPNSVALAISNVDDSTVALVALDLNSSGLIQGLDLTRWRLFMRKDELYSEHWLLAYEGLKKGWLTPTRNRNYISNDPFFNVLFDSNVEFYNPTNQIEPANLAIDREQVEGEEPTETQGYNPEVIVVDFGY